MTEPHKPNPTPTPGAYKTVLPGEDTPPQGSRLRRGTPAAGIDVPRSRPAGTERPKSVRELPDLRGLGSDKDLPKRSELYAEVIRLAPTEAARWEANVTWTGKVLDGQDTFVGTVGHLQEAVVALNSAVEGMSMGMDLSLGVIDGRGKALAGADARAVERVAQLEGDLHGARSELATIKRQLTAKQAFTAGGVGTVLTTILGIIMYLTGHWK